MKKLFTKFRQENIYVLQESKPVVLTFMVIAILVDIFFIKTNSDFIMFSLLGIYIGSIFIYGLKSRLAFIFNILLLIVMFISFVFTGASQGTEKAAVWIYFFLAIGIIQKLRE